MAALWPALAKGCRSSQARLRGGKIHGERKYVQDPPRGMNSTTMIRLLPNCDRQFARVVFDTSGEKYTANPKLNLIEAQVLITPDLSQRSGSCLSVRVKASVISLSLSHHNDPAAALVCESKPVSSHTPILTTTIQQPPWYASQSQCHLTWMPAEAPPPSAQASHGGHSSEDYQVGEQNG